MGLLVAPGKVHLHSQKARALCAAAVGLIFGRFDRPILGVTPSLSTHFNEPRHLAMAFVARSDKQEVACFDRPGEIGDGDFMPTCPAPDVRKQLLLEVSGNACPQYCGRASELRDGLYAAHRIEFSASLPPLVESLRLKST
jgi:hypothetical protein